MSRTSRTAIAGLAGAGALLLSAGPASAHVFAEETEVAAGAFSQVSVTVPHGCEGSPTTSLEVEVPEDILSINPEVHPGWDIEVETEALAEPIEGEHETVTERDAVVTFTAQAGNELPDNFRDTFVLGYQAPDTPGEYLFFKTIQTCAEGETAWIEEYTGEGEEPEHPSPAIAVVEASGDDHGHSDDAEAGDAETVAADTAAESSDDSHSDGLAIAALVVGSLGLVVGGIALARGRSSQAS